jgi:hypothetical protein
MTEATTASGARRGVYMFGPDPASGTFEMHQCEIVWEPKSDTDEIDLWAEGPFGKRGLRAPNVFLALFVLRQDLNDEGWRPIVKAARRDAWHGTPQYPCAPHEVCVYPTFGAPPTGRADALDWEPDPYLIASWFEQQMYRDEWAGTVPPGTTTWSEYDRQRRIALGHPPS